MFKKSQEYVHGEFFIEYEKPIAKDKEELLLMIFELENSTVYYLNEIEEELFLIRKKLKRIRKKEI